MAGAEPKPLGRARRRLPRVPGVREGYVVPRTRLRDPSQDVLAARLLEIRREAELPVRFPAAVEQAAVDAVAGARLPERDLTDVPFVTIDPPGSTDLDQALHLERAGSGYRVRYAIADLAPFVAPGGVIDVEAHERGQTVYAPDGRVPLHPTSISEGAASLLEGDPRSAYVWDLALDADGALTDVVVARAAIRNHHRYDYETVQGRLDAGEPDEWMLLLREIGLLRFQQEAARGGASLNRPDEEVIAENGHYSLTRRMTLPAEDWNAQLSLLTGMAAADLMLEAGVGILRTMPPPEPDRLERFRRQVDALGCPWPAEQDYGAYLRALDPRDPVALAVIHAAASLFRGAGYTVFDGEPPEDTVQAAVAAPYAHATAPLRRLVDRYALAACEAIFAGAEVPDWVRDALPELPRDMARSDGRANRVEKLSVDAIEAALLHGRVGEVFDAVVIQTNQHGGVIQLRDPVVTADMTGSATPGTRVRAELVSADIAAGAVSFRRAAS